MSMNKNPPNSNVVYDSGYVPLFARVTCVIIGLVMLGICAVIIAAGARVIDIFPATARGFNLWWKISVISAVLLASSIVFLQVWFERVSLVLDRQENMLIRVSALMLWTTRHRVPVSSAKSVVISCSYILASPAWDVKLMLVTDKCFWLARMYSSEAAIELAEDICQNLQIPLSQKPQFA